MPKVLLGLLVLMAATAAIGSGLPVGGLLSLGAVYESPGAAAEPPATPRSVPTPSGRDAAAAPAATPTAPAAVPEASPRPVTREAMTPVPTPTMAPTARAEAPPVRAEAPPVRADEPTARGVAPSPSPSPTVSAGTECGIGETFAALARAIGDEATGRCLESEFVNLSTGDTHQRTARGLFVWLKSRNVPAFTDGGTTWYRCGENVEKRASTAPFPC